MSDIPAELKYMASHEWVRLNDDGNFVIGITDHAQQTLGEIVYVELPEKDDDFEAGDSGIVVESVKAASDVYCPVAGKVVAINVALEETPELVNESPYGDGWLMVIEPVDASTFDGLMDAKAYAAEIEEA